MNFTKFLLLKYKYFFGYVSLIMLVYILFCLAIIPFNSTFLKFLIWIVILISWVTYILFSFINYNFKENSDLIKATLKTEKDYCPNTQNKVPWYMIYTLIMLGWSLGLYFLTQIVIPKMSKKKGNPTIFGDPSTVQLNKEYNILLVFLSAPLLILYFFGSNSLINISQLNPLLEKLSKRYKVDLLPNSLNNINIILGIILVSLVIFLCVKVIDFGKETPKIFDLAAQGSVVLISFILFSFYFLTHNNNYVTRNYYNILNNRRFDLNTQYDLQDNNY